MYIHKGKKKIKIKLFFRVMIRFSTYDEFSMYFDILQVIIDTNAYIQCPVKARDLRSKFKYFMNLIWKFLKHLWVLVKRFFQKYLY